MNVNFNELIGAIHRAKEIIQNETLRSQITQKGTSDFVTQVDFKVQAFLKDYLDEHYEHFDFIAEEQKQNISVIVKPTFILDPIDGTANLIKGYNHSAISLGYAENNEIIFGVVYNPFTEETFSAEKGKGAYLNGKKIHISTVSKLDECLITVGTSPYKRERAKNDFNAMLSIFRDVSDIRRSGSSALDICYVASGRSEAFFERNLKPWDYSAGIIILKESGGTITNWSNKPLSLTSPSDVLASNGIIHNYMLKKLQK